ncbi:DoxX family protein [Goodfellowiella coeruleoviolacea]|uniref:Oxidoreductase n=1 Tax=Goodfellowiella coeruleoviolacea TaxID=334858 RepID=A0AAE3KPL7_9PSEU|nr:DoxX family protein [Goodfellowiella coeruleoviolacea]MCP2170003.1 putative oxidoreductase [Goodfellowiella coeruleoviolacea]
MRLLRDLTALVARLAIGVVFIAHGWQKFTEWGLAGTAASFEKMGIPAATLSAWFAATVELVGGVLLIAGLALPVVGVLLAVDMAGALLFVHLPNGLLGDGGFEYVLVLAVAALAVGFNGGAYALDRVVFRNRGARRAQEPVPSA